MKSPDLKVGEFYVVPTTESMFVIEVVSLSSFSLGVIRWWGFAGGHIGCKGTEQGGPLDSTSCIGRSMGKATLITKDQAKQCCLWQVFDE